MINIISLDTTWRSGETINLTDLVQIAPGVTLTIEAGAIVNGNNQTIQTFGTLKATGLASDKIEFNDTRFIFGGDNKTPGRIEISHALVNDGAFLPATGNSSYGSFSVTDSTLTSVQGFYIWYPTSTSSFERNIFFQSDGLFIGTSSVEFFVTNNVFAKQNGPAIQNWASYGGINLVVEHNSFLSTDLVALSLPGGYTSAAMLAENNYFGTTDLANISTRVYDRTDSLSAASVIDYDPILTQAHANTPIFNLVVVSNTAPILSGIPGIATNVTVGTLYALADFTVADVDGNSLTVSLMATNGILNGVTDANPSLAGTQLTGTAASINTALAAATFTATTAGAASIIISLSDGVVTNPITAVYTFAAAPTLGPTDDFVVLQPTTSTIAGAGAGNDTYLLSGSMIPAGKAITLSDASGSNTLQLAPGLSVASSQVSATALKLNLTNGASLTVLGADKFSYDVGGNLSAGLSPNLSFDLSFTSFVQNTLGTTIPATGLGNAGALVVENGAAASLLASTASGDDFIVPQRASSAIVGAGAGNDTYLLAQDLLPAGTNLTISDALGTNSIQLASGLQIASAQVAATALKLNLTSGASITVLGANAFTFEAGGNTTAGINQPDISYSQFVQTVLGISIPATGLNTSGAVTIGGSTGGASTIGVSGNQVVNATAAADVFGFNAVSALADVTGTNTQATISGFSTANDRLLIDLATANASLTRLDQLSGVQGVSVQVDPFTATTLVAFGNDANGGQPVTLSLVGITNPAAVQIQVV